jgi:hypothetical protein
MTSVVFYEEKTGLSRTFDCSAFPLARPMQQWMARLLADQFSARSGPKRFSTARGYYNVLTQFAKALASFQTPPRVPQELVPEHFQAFRRRHEATPYAQRSYVQSLRRMLRGRDELPPSARRELMRTRLAPVPAPVEVVAYTDGEWQQFMTALRRDIRTSRDRIRAGLALLARFRTRDLPPGGNEELLGAWLDHFARTGTAPPRPLGRRATELYRQAGSARGIASRLCLTQTEACSFALYLAALTAQNFGTVATWPAAHTRPDTGTGPVRVALLEGSKPRRGPEREHMVTAMEDVPPSLREVLADVEPDERLLRSALRVYELLLELTGTARRLSGDAAAFLSHAPASARKDGQPWTALLDVDRWSENRGFPTATRVVADGPPSLHVGRIRQTALELQRRPVAHSRQTLRDHYLRRSATVQAESRTVVATALRKQVTKARTAGKVPVFTPDLLARATEDPQAAAAEAGLEPEVLKRLMSREQDTVVTACADHLAGPDTEPGQPCTASFLACLDCGNARALPHQLPVQLALRDRLLALRPNAEPATWKARYEARVDQLEEIISHYKPAEQERQRRLLTSGQGVLIDDLLAGRMVLTQK